MTSLQEAGVGIWLSILSTFKSKTTNIPFLPKPISVSSWTTAFNQWQRSGLWAAMGACECQLGSHTLTSETICGGIKLIWSLQAQWDESETTQAHLWLWWTEKGRVKTKGWNLSDLMMFKLQHWAALYNFTPSFEAEWNKVELRLSLDVCTVSRLQYESLKQTVKIRPGHQNVVVFLSSIIKMLTWVLVSAASCFMYPFY